MSIRRYIRTALPLLLIIVVVLAAYANAWPNTLVHDDKFYAGSERFTELANIPRYFTENAWASSGVANRLYRPLLLVSITLDARLYGDWVAGYHLSNIILHVLVTHLVFGFLLQLLRMTNGRSSTDVHVALLVALVFAVHPVYTEVVNSIFNRSEMLVALGGLAGLLWFLRHIKTGPARAWAGLGIAYLLVLFSKESGIVLPGLAVILVLILTPGNWRTRVKKCLPVFWLLIPLVLYFGLRAQALAPIELVGPISAGPGQVTEAAHGSGLDLMLESFNFPEWWRVKQVAGVWYESFKIMLWPFPLKIDHSPISQFARMAGLTMHLTLALLALFQLKRGHYGLIIGLLFFYIAMLPASRIIGDPGTVPHLAERYLYFPTVGLAIVLAFGLRVVPQRFDILKAASVIVLAIIMLTPVTWARNAVWASEVQLYESDYSNGNFDSTFLVWLTIAHLKNADFSRVVEICDRHIDVQKRSGKLSSHCATAYSRTGRLDEAEQAYLFSTRDRAVSAMAHANLGRFYLRLYRWRDAKNHFEMAVEAEKLPANRAYRHGHMLVRLYPSDRKKLLEAKALFELALELQPALLVARHWLTRVDRTLGAP